MSEKDICLIKKLFPLENNANLILDINEFYLSCGISLLVVKEINTEKWVGVNIKK